MKILVRDGDRFTIELPGGQEVQIEYRETGSDEDYPGLPELEVLLPSGTDGNGMPIAKSRYLHTIPKGTEL